MIHLEEQRENPAIAGDSSLGMSHPRVAFAVPRAVGSAVVRNRVRRRIRSTLSCLADSGRLTPGAWLFIVRPGAAILSFVELDDVVTRAVESLASRRVAS